MDAVITYVNGADPQWLESYEKHSSAPINKKRYRDWGTLKYLLRSIDEYMPFVENVYLVVCSESQVPEWAGENLKIVLHKDIIPESYLPSFNSAVIELFLHRIPGLAEEFIFYNDDMYNVMPCKSEDFFRDGKAAINFRRNIFYSGQYKKHTRNSYLMACRAAGVKPRKCFLRPWHSAMAMLKSENEKVFKMMENEILPTISTLRSDYNVNQYLYSDYLKMTGKTVTSRLKKAHYSLSIVNEKRLRRFFSKPGKEMVCVNDTNVSEARFNAVSKALNEALEKKFPAKCRFEK